METNTHNAFDFPLFDTTEQKGKSMPPYTNLSLFLIISSKFYISQPQNVMNSEATMVFGRNVYHGSSFEKDS